LRPSTKAETRREKVLTQIRKETDGQTDIPIIQKASWRQGGVSLFRWRGLVGLSLHGSSSFFVSVIPRPCLLSCHTLARTRFSLSSFRSSVPLSVPPPLSSIVLEGPPLSTFFSSFLSFFAFVYLFIRLGVHVCVVACIRAWMCCVYVCVCVSEHSCVRFFSPMGMTKSS